MKWVNCNNVILVVKQDQRLFVQRDFDSSESNLPVILFAAINALSFLSTLEGRPAKRAMFSSMYHDSVSELVRKNRKNSRSWDENLSLLNWKQDGCKNVVVVVFCFVFGCFFFICLFVLLIF